MRVSSDELKIRQGVSKSLNRERMIFRYGLSIQKTFQFKKGGFTMILVIILCIMVG